FALRARHLLVPHEGTVAPFLDRHVGERHRERPDRADHVDLVAEAVHAFELLVEIEPLGPAVEVLAAVGAPHVIVAAAPIDPRAGVVLAPGELVENRPGPPMEMRVDDVHGASCRCETMLRSRVFPVNETSGPAHDTATRFG